MSFETQLGVRTVKKNKRANETATSVRKDMRINKELLDRIDNVRGDVPFAAWVKRAIIMRLDGLNCTSTIKSVPVVTHTATKKTVTVRTANEKRSIETKQKLFGAIKLLKHNEKIEIINSRYPKSKCRKAVGEIVSKDTISKYWAEIEMELKN